MIKTWQQYKKENNIDPLWDINSFFNMHSIGFEDLNYFDKALNDGNSMLEVVQNVVKDQDFVEVIYQTRRLGHRAVGAYIYGRRK